MTAKKAKADHPLDGEQILRDPTRNKGLAFTREERRLLGIEGLLPPAILTPLISISSLVFLPLSA